jgi:hypothetical protein
MKTKMITALIVSQILEFGVYGLIALGITHFYPVVNPLSLFLVLAAIDIILTGIFCGDSVRAFISALFHDETKEDV